MRGNYTGREGQDGQEGEPAELRVSPSCLSCPSRPYEGTIRRYETRLLLGKDLTAEKASEALDRTVAAVQELPEWTAAALEAAIRPLGEPLGLKNGPYFGILRVATTGRTAAPPLFETMAVLGHERTPKRLRHAGVRDVADGPLVVGEDEVLRAGVVAGVRAAIRLRITFQREPRVVHARGVVQTQEGAQIVCQRLLARPPGGDRRSALGIEGDDRTVRR